MADGTPKAEVFTNFHKYLTKLRSHADVLQQAVRADGQRTWFPQANDAGNPDVMPDPLLDRRELNARYDEVTNQGGEGTLGDATALKLQNDYLAQAEQAQRIRNCGQVRAIALAHGRRYGHAKSDLFTDGPGGIQAAVAASIQSGAQTPPV